MRSYIFVSHANEDKPQIGPLLERLLDENIALWIDRPEEILGERYLQCGRIMPTADWKHEISDALEGAACVLFVLSVASNDPVRSDELIREFNFGEKQNKLLIAEIESIPEKELNPFFRVKQSINILGQSSPGQYDESKIQVLLHRLRQHLSAHAYAASGAGSAEPPPRLRPYLTDRTEQHRRLTGALQRQIDAGRGEPLMFVALGSEDQCIDSFVERVRYVDLPDLLQKNELAPDVQFVALNWPGAESTAAVEIEAAGQLEDLQKQFRGLLGLRTSVPLSSVEARLAKSPQCCCVHIDLSLDNWEASSAQLLGLWLRWWTAIDLSGGKLPLLTIVSIVYPSGWLNSILRRNAIRSFLRDIDRLAREPHLKSNVHVLPELRSVRLQDVEAWIRAEVQNVDREVLRRKVSRYFSLPLGIRQKRLSMYDAAAAVKAALMDPEVRTVRT